MKLRKGFVSNSSSSSFVVDKNLTNAVVCDKIRNHMEVAREMYADHEDEWTEVGYIDDNSDAWSIHEYAEKIEGYTSMNNFDMEAFFEKIGVPKEAYKFDHS